MDEKNEQKPLKKKMKCPACNGDGFTAEHNPNSINFKTGEHDCSRCPIQVQCELCQGTGLV